MSSPKNLGFDFGTYNLVVCGRDKDNGFVSDREVNAFIEIPLDDRLVFNMMDSVGVPMIEMNDKAYALGEAAVSMAYTLNSLELKRPMTAGCVNPKEKDAFQVLSIMAHNLLENQTVEGRNIVYYSVPANAINEETDADYHQRILDAILKAYGDETKKVEAYPINEALALVYAEMRDKMFTGVGISCGAGMVNVCFAMFGKPVFSFAIVNSGDWIDRQAAKATGETIAYINREKTKIDLNAIPTGMVERAIQTQYRLMIEKTVAGIAEGLRGLKSNVRIEKPVDFVVAGGTSLPNGFDTLFREALEKAKLPVELGSVVRPKDALYSVARGCLIAAENAKHI